MSLAFAAKRPRRHSWLGASTLEVSSGVGQSTVEMHDMSNDSGLSDNHHHLGGDGTSSVMNIIIRCWLLTVVLEQYLFNSPM